MGLIAFIAILISLMGFWALIPWVQKVVLIVLVIVFGLGTTVLLYDFSSKLFVKLAYKGGRETRKPVFGFTTAIIMGMGATIGISLFTVLPYTISKFEPSSTFLALLFSMLISFLLARGYGNMYSYTLRHRGEECIGGPAFVKQAFGLGSLYFISRISMWIGNTALASFNAIIFYDFLFKDFISALSQRYNVFVSYVTISLLFLLFTIWLYFFFKYESKEKERISKVQITLFSIFLFFLALHVYFFIVTPGSYPVLNRVLTFNLETPINTVFATGFVYIVFFGFQEIQALAMDVKEEVKVPIFGEIKKERYLTWAMILTVIFSSVIFLCYFFSMSKFEITGVIPPLEIVKNQGDFSFFSMSTAFLIASVTTLIPAYIAASRHLSELANDGFIPRRLSNYSWLFTLSTLVFMALQNPDFLIGTADMSILLSLSFIALSELRLHQEFSFQPFSMFRVSVTSVTCLVVALSFYFLHPAVFYSGFTFIFMSWLLFSLIRVKKVLNLFLSILGFVTFLIVRQINIGVKITLFTLLTSRFDLILGVMSIVLLLDFLFSLEVSKYTSLVIESLKSLLLETSNFIDRVIGVTRKRISEEKLYMDKYKIISAALEAEKMKEVNPEFYQRIKKIIEKDLKALEDLEERRGK